MQIEENKQDDEELVNRVSGRTMKRTGDIQSMQQRNLGDMNIVFQIFRGFAYGR